MSGTFAAGHYFIACSRNIELNPFRAWMVAEPGDLPWSSYAANAWGRPDSLLTPHAEYLALGCDDAVRAATYLAPALDGLSKTLVAEIRHYLQQQNALGSDRFRACVEARTGRFETVRPQALPRRQNVPHTIFNAIFRSVEAAGDAHQGFA